MVSNWETGIQYDLGSVVIFEGRTYEIIQPHRSQGNWSPPVTPALWRLLPKPYNEEHQVPISGYKPHPEQEVEVTHEEQKKNWYDLDDHRKKELEIGGGLLAGAALLGGGFAAWKHHEKSQEENKALTWALQNWLRDAQSRTERYNNNGPTGPATWILNRGQGIPDNAIQGGQDKNGTALYISRAFQDGGVQIGKASSTFNKGAIIGYKHEEIEFDTYEILVGDNSGVQWIDVSGTIDITTLGVKPVEGGRENDGTPLYVVQAPHQGGVHPGKANPKHAGAFITYQGKEVQVNEYRVLTYA